MVLDATTQALLATVQDGLPLVSKPYAVIAQQLGISEQEVVRRLAELIQGGMIKRLGVVVRHHELGYRANAMVVWNVPDERLEEVGNRLGSIECVTLCYQRPRRLPLWPYNLFSMIHGRDRGRVLARIADIVNEVGLHDISYAVLFSARRFKQRGARYVGAQEAPEPRRVAHG